MSRALLFISFVELFSLYLILSHICLASDASFIMWSIVLAGPRAKLYSFPFWTSTTCRSLLSLLARMSSHVGYSRSKYPVRSLLHWIHLSSVLTWYYSLHLYSHRQMFRLKRSRIVVPFSVPFLLVYPAGENSLTDLPLRPTLSCNSSVWLFLWRCEFTLYRL